MVVTLYIFRVDSVSNKLDIVWPAPTKKLSKEDSIKTSLKGLFEDNIESSGEFQLFELVDVVKDKGDDDVVVFYSTIIPIETNNRAKWLDVGEVNVEMVKKAILSF